MTLTSHAYYRICDIVLNNKGLRNEEALTKYLKENANFEYTPTHVEAALVWVQQFEPNHFECYECGTVVPYLFPDSRCKNCTRITPDELTGGD